MSCEFLSTSYKFIYTSYEFKFLSNKFKCFSYEFKSASYEFKSTSYEFKSTSSSTIKSIKKISKQAFKTTKGNSFPKVVSSKLLRQHVISTCGGNLSHYVAATPWLWLQQDAEWININFWRWDLNSLHKNHPPPMILEKFVFSFVFNLRKQNVTDFSFIFLTQGFVLRF